MVGDKPGELRHELNRADEQALVLAVRNAKELSDFVIFHMHDHLNRSLFQAYSHSNYPADYLRPLLHTLIDNGLDMYVGSGVHTVQGIEIYKGRPIFYNQGNIGADLVRGLDSTPDSHGMTRTELTERQRAGFFSDESTSIAYVANTTYKDGRLVEIRIYPVDIGLGARPWSRENVPTTPTPDKARSILQRLQKYSEPFGTTISIENNIGVIRVPPEATVDVGGDLDIPGRQPAGQ
jgi:poly-gamma-glutamate capsule biosynthesis protein CapA/YwtB (metallophosphatase superfamily)